MFYKGNEDREKQLRFSIRKVSFGAASVAVAALFMFPGNGTVSATEQGVTPTNEGRQGSPLKEPDVQNGTYGATPVVSQLDGNSGSSEASAPKNQEGTSTPTSTDASAPSVESPTVSATEEKSAEKNTEVPSTEANSVENKEQTRVKTEEKAATPVTESHKPKLRKKRDISATPDADVATDDPSANQTYTAPSADASVNQLAKALQDLPDKVENNDKLSKNMENLGASKNVSAGQVLEIDEFGGWKAVGENGKFAIAKKTDAGVFPIETVNTVYAQNRNGSDKHYKTYTGEQAFDRTANYMLFLSEVRTHASANDGAYDGSEYQGTGLSGSTAKAVKNYDGIEKTFKAYSTEVGSKVKIQFKTGYTGDIDGTKAKYKVEVIVNKNGKLETVYSKTFDPQKDLKDSDATVTKARDGNGKFIRSNFNNRKLNKTEVESKMKGDYIPTGTAGTFESKEIDLEKGVTDYTVRISSADNEHLGMGYQSPLRQYALPISGLGFNITQDTNKIAKDLLSRIYEKLKATETEDTYGKTNDTKAAYLAELENTNTLITSTDVKTTEEYKKALESILLKRLALEVDKSELTNAKEALNTLATEADPTTGKTADSAQTYNDAKTAAQEAIQEAETVINDENATPEKVREALNKVNEKKAALEAAKQALVEAATPEEKAKLKTAADSLVKADETGKTPESIAAYERKYEELKAQLEAAKAAAAAVEAKGDNATKAEVQEAQAQVEAAKAELTKAAELLKALDRDGAKKEIEAAAKKAIDVIEASPTLTPEQKAEEKAKVAKEVKDATDAIDKATTEDGINSAKDKGKLAIEKEVAITAINAEKTAKEKEIDNNSNLSDDEKAAAKEEAKAAADKAIQAIDAANDQAGVDKAQADGIAAVAAVNPVAKDKAKEAVAAKLKEKEAEIDANANLSDAEK
ncbi:DUF1542 domain-containing protein, partial [Streptococcus pseudopneumoniae]|uniref:DUF1542 domain-containing protein n=1 Tax=Streptococcus pseudopneumoniae TaxID=257758 RepID=UPI00110C2F83